SGLLQVWYTQMLNDNLRQDAASKTNGNKYYDLPSQFAENTFTIRRSEIKISGAILDGVTYEVMFDPSISTSATNPSILQDAAIKYTTDFGLEFKLGQFRPLQTYEASIRPTPELIFAERAQMTRRFGDKRDRGVTAAYAFGDKEFGGKATVGVFNGMSDAISGKGNDTNAQKDFVARLEFNLGKEQQFGVYTLQGGTDLKDANGSLVARAFAGPNAPAAADILADKDKTTNLGAYYVYDNGAWHFDGEVMTGKLGRRLPSLGAAAGPAGREALDQKYLGYYATATYTTGPNTFALRYDSMNYNQGDKWYTAYDPYTESAPGTPLLVNGAPVDYTPKFREVTAGYTYAFKPEKLKAANIKVNYIWRSKNFLAPGPTQTGEQGGDTAVVAFQIAF
ncbi:MAG TPA: porin, partial [Holophagaceae bacterium]|nr:porin [Holophagaceae bacterium]